MTIKELRNCCLVTGAAALATSAIAAPVPGSARQFAEAQAGQNGFDGVTPILETVAATGNYVGMCNLYWDNGDFDAVFDDGIWAINNGFLSSSSVADDLYLPDGKCYRLDQISVLMMSDVDMAAEGADIVYTVYADMNGTPGSEVARFSQAELTDPESESYNPGVVVSSFDTGDDWLGYDIIEYTFDLTALGCWLDGGCSYWIGVECFGTESSEKCWVATTASGDATNPNSVQVNQAQFKLPFNGFNDWTPVEVTNNKKSDLALAVGLTPREVISDAGDPVNTVPLTPMTNQVFGAVAADNFVLPPCESYEIDMVETCVWTNCGCGDFVLEIWSNDPETMCPGTLIATFENPKDESLGMTTMTTDTPPLEVEAFKLQFSELDLVLEGGKSYWIVARNTGVANQSDRSYTCYAFDCEKPSDSQIQWMPAKFFSPMLGEEWVDLGSLAGVEPQELAFKITGDVVSIPTPGGVGDDQDETANFSTADMNNDGRVDFSDVGVFLELFRNGN